MKVYLFIYTRLDNFDYRLLYAPSEHMLPYPTRQKFIDFAREVINTDNLNNGTIAKPRWSIFKEDSLMLIGMGCYNELLGVVNQVCDTRSIRGFYGIVVDSPCHSLLPIFGDIDFFRNIFSEYIKPIWALTKKDEHRVNSNIQMIELDDSPNIFLRSTLKLNVHNDICKILPENSSLRDIFLAIMDLQIADIVCNLNTEDHVVNNRLIPFHNITILGNNSESSFKIRIEQPSLNTKVVNKDKHKNQKTNKKQKYGLLMKLIFDKLPCDSIIDFLKEFASKCGFRVVKSEDYSDHINSVEPPTIERALNDVNPDPSSTHDNESEILNFENQRQERKNTLSELRSEYRVKSLDESKLEATTYNDVKLESLDIETERENIEEL